MDKFDVAVVGAGPGGYPAAIRAAQLGAKVAIIERDEIGGTCLNWGCIPTKSLISLANVYADAIEAKRGMGMDADDEPLDFTAAMKHKNAVVEKLRGGVVQLLKANGVKVFTGTGYFKDRNKLGVKDKVAAIGTEKVIIATGSASVVPGFLPKSKRVMDSKAFLNIKSMPERLIVLGGGYIGCELACLAARLGAEVTIVELLEDILVTLDADIRSVVKSHMEKTLGIDIMTGVAMKSATASAKGVEAKCGKKTLKADALLAAVGRKPVTTSLQLGKAGLKTDDHGFLTVDKYGCTESSSIYAVGDVRGGMMLAHAATSEGIVAAEKACGHTSDPNEQIIPSVIFTTPEVATVGISETEAAEQGLSVKVGKFPFSSLGRALAAREEAGFAKWIVDENTDQVLGAAVVGAHATDLISEAGLAIRNELTARELGRTIHAHPTFAEIWMESAHAVHGEAIHAAPRRK